MKKDQLVSALDRQIQKTAQAQDEIEQDIKNKQEARREGARVVHGVFGLGRYRPTCRTQADPLDRRH